VSNDFLLVGQIGAEFNDNHPHMQKILAQLDILYTWAKIHESILERYQSKKYFGFANFSQNESYSNILGLLLSFKVPFG
jgi:hypothetical protein